MSARTLPTDLTPLRASTDFRRLWIAGTVSEIGHQAAVVTLFYHVYRLTHSSAAVGLIGLAQLLPLMGTALLVGWVIDRVDRRRLLLATEAGLVGSSLILVAAAVVHNPPLLTLYAATAVSSALSGVDEPNRTAMVPPLVGDEALPAAFALKHAGFNAAAIAGPAVAGLVIARLGLPAAYALAAAGSGVAFVVTLPIRAMPARPEALAASGFAAVREALAFLKGRRLIQSTFAIDLVAMIFGLPRAVFPVLAVVQFHRGPEVVAALFSALAVGALVGAVMTGWVSRVRHQGQAVVLAVAIWGAAIVAFGLAGDRLWLALGLLALAGGADVISAVFRNTLLQVSLPDRLRGRISAFHILVVTGGPRLGDIEAGILADAFTPAISVVSGGLLCLAGAALIALAFPELRRFVAGQPS